MAYFSATVLFNRGIKSAATNHTTDDLRLKWVETWQFTRKIDHALQNGEIIMNDVLGVCFITMGMTK